MGSKRRNKHPYCLNCGFEFGPQHDNFCPVCGQENDDKRKQLIWFIQDFIEDVISIDNRLYKSIPPFLFYPGKLTLEYLEGRRKAYISPLRLFLTTSLLYFLVFTLILDKKSESKDDTFARKTLKENIVANKDKLVTEINRVDSLVQAQDSLANLHQSTTSFHKSPKKKEVSISTKILGAPIEEITRLMEKPNMTEEAILDSVGMKKTFFNRLLINRTVQFTNLTPKQIIQNYLQTVQLTILCIVPIFALILNIFYYRMYYVSHLVFSLHVHSLWFFVLTALMVPAYLFGLEEEMLMLALILMIIYNYQAFRKVYAQSPWLTIFKLFCFVVFYFILLVMTLLLTLVVSFFFT